jgi:inorganic triphosphatase YgiF
MAAERKVEPRLEFRPIDAKTPRAVVAKAFGLTATAILRPEFFYIPDDGFQTVGLSLPVCRDGDLRIQTLKSAAMGSGLFDRMQGEAAMTGDRPVSDAKDMPAMIVDYGERRCRINKIEFALRRGTVSSLFAVARILDGVAPPRETPGTKQA